MNDDHLEEAKRQFTEMLRNAPKPDRPSKTSWLQCPDCGDVWSKGDDEDDWDRRNALVWSPIKPPQRGELLDDNGQPTYLIRCPQCSSKAMLEFAMRSYARLKGEESQ